MKFMAPCVVVAPMLLGCHPPYSLRDRDPLFPVEGDSTAAHTIPVDTVSRWIREGRCQGTFVLHPRPGRPLVVYSFGGGVEVGLYENTDAGVRRKIWDAADYAPDKAAWDRETE